MIIIELLLAALALALLIFSTFLLVQVVAAVVGGKDNASLLNASARPRLAVLVPAHDEALVIGATLKSIRSQLQPGDQLLVVADNCSDSTADIAAAAGAIVVERSDAERVGKAYALEAGLRGLAAIGPPDVVAFVDADCGLGEGALDRLASAAATTSGPVQGSYTMLAPGTAPANIRLSAFAVQVRNRVRPLGSRALGLHGMITGSGWAAPWDIAAKHVKGGACIVEDLELSLQFALAGIRTVFVPGAVVTGDMPIDAEARAKQQQRWEQGAILTSARFVPLLLKAAFRQRSIGLLALAIELCVPPLLTLGALVGATSVLAAAVMALGGSVVPLILSLTALCFYLAALGICFVRFSNGTVGVADLAQLPVLVARKFGTYGALLRGRHVTWVRTPRETQGPAKD